MVDTSQGQGRQPFVLTTIVNIAKATWITLHNQPAVAIVDAVISRTLTPPSLVVVRVTRQVSANVLLGRSHIGVHWRMDGVNGALMGETSAVRRLQQVCLAIRGLS